MSIIATGTIGFGGSPWTIYSDGLLEIETGTIDWSGTTVKNSAWVPVSPWDDYALKIEKIEILGPITAGPSIRHLFGGLLYVFEIIGLEKINTSAVIDMTSLFENTRRLAALDLSAWDTSAVTSMNSLFYNAWKLDTLDLTGWNTSAVVDMSKMFSGLKNLPSLDLTPLATSSVTNMTSMFEDSTSLINLDVTGWNTSSVTKMTRMFCMAKNLTVLNLSSWNCASVKDMSLMFSETENLVNVNVSSWETSEVEDMTMMFYQASKLESLDLSSWDTTLGLDNKRDMNFMFEGTLSLNYLTLGPLFEFIFYCADAAIPEIEPTSAYTGFWQNIGIGTASNPNGGNVLTSKQLMETYEGNIMADTYVWQPV